MLPKKLYHGSGFNDRVLKPGFEHTDIEVHWDETESNKFLYATTDKESAIGLGWASSIEKSFELDRFKIEPDTIIIELSPKHQSATLRELTACPVFLYTLTPKPADQWVLVDNAVNNFQTEYKTQATIKVTTPPARVDLRTWLRGKKIVLNRKPPASASW